MRCPYCDNEMERGFIRSRDPIYWRPQGAKWLPGVLAKGSILLRDADVHLDLMRRERITAHRCAACERIVIDYGDSAQFRVWSPDDASQAEE